MSRIAARLKSLFNVRDGEGRLVLLVLSYAILLYFSNVLARTACYTLFLSKFDAATLPYAYVGISLAAPLISAIYLRLNSSYSLSRVLLGIHVALFASLLGYRLGLGVAGDSWLFFGLPIYFGVINSLTISSFWNLLGRVFDLQQGKRLFGLLSSGEHMAATISGFLTPIIVSQIGTTNLLLVSALAMIAATAALSLIARLNRGSLEAVDVASTEDDEGRPKGVVNDPYVRLIIGVFGLFVVGIYFVDNIFYFQAQERFPSEDELASFLGIFSGVFGVLSLFVQAFLAGRLLNRYGVRAMLLATPLGLLTTTVSFAVAGLFSRWQLLLFWLATVANMYRSVLDAVDSAAVNILYQPLPAQQRTQAQTTVTGIAYPVAIGLAGVLLLLLTKGLNLNPTGLSVFLVFILFLWLTVAIALGRQYPLRLRLALRRRALQGAAMPRPDRASLAIFRNALASEHVGTVIYAMQVLQDLAPEVLAEQLPLLLNHPNAEVSVQALSRVEHIASPESRSLLRERLGHERRPVVRATLVRILAKTGEVGSWEDISALLEHESAAFVQGALVGILESNDPKGVVQAKTRLSQLAASKNGSSRELAAGIIAGSRRGDLAPVLKDLLQDDLLNVRLAALKAAEAVNLPELWPHVIALLRQSDTRSAAGLALAAGGVAVLPHIREIFRQPEQDRQVLVRLVRMCCQLDRDAVASFLLDNLDHGDYLVRTEILAALNRCDYRAEPELQPLIRAHIVADIGRFINTLAAQVAIRDMPEFELLTTTLDQDRWFQAGNVFRLLGTLYDRDVIGRAWEILGKPTHTSEEQRAYALESLELVLSKEMRPMVIPLVDKVSQIERLNRLRATFAYESLTLQAQLSRFLGQEPGEGDPWLVACVLFGLRSGEQLAQSLREEILSALETWKDNLLVSETAAWVLARPEPTEQVDAIGDHPLMTLESVAFLRRVTLLAETDVRTLGDMASLLCEERRPAGEEVFSVGQPGDSMYFIASGTVRVHDGKVTLSELTAGEAFGEMALLDGAPRIASVTTVVDTVLLRMDRVPFQAFAMDRIGVLRGIIKVLSRYLRERLHDVAQIRSTLEPVASTSVADVEETSATHVVGELLPLEKILILKGVELFADCDDDLLAAIAGLMQEVALEPEQTLFEMGDTGDAMYIIIGGAVRIHEGGQTIDVLGDGRIVGEMAILDDTPRVASATAIQPSKLLKLSRAPFQELMEDRVEIAKGIATVLSRRLRRRVKELAELSIA